jgi:putative pyrroloquinoline-quinone-binding quinoprotein
MVKRHAVVAGGALSLLVVGVLTLRLARRGRVAEPSLVTLASQTKVGENPAKPRRPPDGKVAPGPPTMLHLDPRHTNRSPFAGPGSPNVAWTFDTGGPIEAAPAMLDDGTIVVASLGGKLFGLDEQGELRYSVDLGDRVYASHSSRTTVCSSARTRTSSSD